MNSVQPERPFGSGDDIRPPREDFAIQVNARAIAARAKSGKAVRQIAEETGIEQYVFDAYLAGSKPWRSDHAERFAIACGVPVVALLIGADLAATVDVLLSEGES
jgi:hypothetical protein